MTMMTSLLRLIVSLPVRAWRALRRSSSAELPAADMRSPPPAKPSGTGWNARLL
jgi:hypothetical protein